MYCNLLQLTEVVAFAVRINISYYIPIANTAKNCKIISMIISHSICTSNTVCVYICSPNKIEMYKMPNNTLVFNANYMYCFYDTL